MVLNDEVLSDTISDLNNLKSLSHDSKFSKISGVLNAY